MPDVGMNFLLDEEKSCLSVALVSLKFESVRKQLHSTFFFKISESELSASHTHTQLLTLSV